MRTLAKPVSVCLLGPQINGTLLRPVGGGGGDFTRDGWKAIFLSFFFFSLSLSLSSWAFLSLAFYGLKGFPSCVFVVFMLHERVKKKCCFELPP